MPAPIASLKTSLNAMREVITEGDRLYHQYIPEIVDDSDLGKYGAAVNQYTSTQNAFMDVLMNRLVYTVIVQKDYANPLSSLQGDALPLGYAGQEIYTNPAIGRQFNDEDYMGLLKKYEADVKVQYFNVNKELQYPVSVGRDRLEQAFVSWENLNSFVGSIVDSLYKGLYIDKFRYTKGLVAAAYKSNQVQVQVINQPTTEATAKEMVKAIRGRYFAFTMPSSENNAWAQVGGAGRPITTWANPEDIVLLVRGDIRAELDVDVLSVSFNMNKTDLLGKILTVDNFNVYDRDTGELVYDGSDIIAIMADKSWFKIRDQKIQLDQFYNANNMVWNYYLQAFMMYQYSFFANAVVFATKAPEVATQSLSFAPGTDLTVVQGGTSNGTVTVNPPESTDEVTYTVTGTGVTITPNASNDRQFTISATAGAATGQRTLTVKAGAVTITQPITVTAVAAQSAEVKSDEPKDA